MTSEIPNELFVSFYYKTYTIELWWLNAYFGLVFFYPKMILSNEGHTILSNYVHMYGIFWTSRIQIQLISQW